MISKQEGISMNESKFTKGEWEVANGLLVGEQVLFIYTYHPKQVICRLTKQVDTSPLTDEDVANAHLIKTSPKLYQTLKYIVEEAKDFTERTGTEVSWVEMAESILSEARGGA